MPPRAHTAAPGPTCSIELRRHHVLRSLHPCAFRLLAAASAIAAPGTAGGDDRGEVILSDGPTEAPPKQGGIAFYEDLAKTHADDPEAHQTLAAAYARHGKL